MHRNSQKRIYVQKSVYFITTNTCKRYPYFKEDIFCELFIEELRLCQKRLGFEILGYKINHEHIHLLLLPAIGHNFSKIMAFLKKNFSRDINHVLKGDIPECRLSGSQYSARYDRNFEIPHLIKYRTELLKKYPKEIPFPPFKWQKSFHFHIIEDDQDLHNHIEYIKSQWIKHGLEENKWCYLSDSFK